MLRSAKRRRFLVGLAVAISIGAVFCIAFGFNLLYGVQLQSSDFLFRAASLNQNGELEEKIVVIGIDDKSLEQLGRFASWPRSHYANLIDVLAEAKARVVVFDILFSEPAVSQSGGLVNDAAATDQPAAAIAGMLALALLVGVGCKWSPSFIMGGTVR